MSYLENAKKVIELKQNNLINSDAFQNACREFLEEKMTAENFMEHEEALSLFDADIKNYLQAMAGMNSWRDFKKKYMHKFKFD